MIKRIGNPLYLILLLLVLCGCGGGEDTTPEEITLLGINANGGSISNGATNIPIDTQVEFVFSATLNTSSFMAALTVTTSSGTPDFSVSYSNASSKAILSFEDLDYETQYEIKIKAAAIGSNGQVLSQDIVLAFTTMEDGVVREMPACTSASQDCYRTVSLQDASQNSGNFRFYANYPIYLENAQWEKLKYAIIVVHGANRDADNYFNFLVNPLNSEGLMENTILISPEFKDNSTASNNDLYWNSDWREGQKSTSNTKISSFEAIDAILTRLSDREAFPVLEKVIVTGHSSGGLFTQVYGLANQAESQISHLSFDYVVTNSQYFYYPDEKRYDEQNNQFYTPSGCASYNQWPLGYTNPPAYVSAQGETQMDANLLSRNFTYFLGNGSQADPALNTNDCGAILLGSSRFKRGEHIYAWLESEYSSQHNSTKVVVDGIGHDGQGMYQSNDFKTLLGDILN
ncbi:MAG: Ig-like domain-containing protein [Cytophagia bacterium]|nr:Ig-like domain-containing protein [Cytophagia bacterium]